MTDGADQSRAPEDPAVDNQWWRHGWTLTLVGVAVFMALSGMFVLLVLTAGGAGSAASASGPGQALPTPTCHPQGNVLHISAYGLKFDTDCLAAPADRPFTIVFHNRDAGVPHDVSIAPLQSMSRTTNLLFHGAIVTGPTTVVYHVPALPAGTYYFVCVVHPWAMRGVFVVG